MRCGRGQTTQPGHATFRAAVVADVYRDGAWAGRQLGRAHWAAEVLPQASKLSSLEWEAFEVLEAYAVGSLYIQLSGYVLGSLGTKRSRRQRAAAARTLAAADAQHLQGLVAAARPEGRPVLHLGELTAELLDRGLSLDQVVELLAAAELERVGVCRRAARDRAWRRARRHRDRHTEDAD